MKRTFAAFIGLLMSSQLSAFGQLVAPVPLLAKRAGRANKVAAPPESRKKVVTPAVAAPTPAEERTVPSWLPAAAPERPAATRLTDVTDTKLDVRFD